MLRGALEAPEPGALGLWREWVRAQGGAPLEMERPGKRDRQGRRGVPTERVMRRGGGEGRHLEGGDRGSRRRRAGCGIRRGAEGRPAREVAQENRKLKQEAAPGNYHARRSGAPHFGQSDQVLR